MTKLSVAQIIPQTTRTFLLLLSFYASLHPIPLLSSLSVPIEKKVNTYASQLPLKTTDARRDAAAVYVSLSLSPPPPLSA